MCSKGGVMDQKKFDSKNLSAVYRNRKIKFFQFLNKNFQNQPKYVRSLLRCNVFRFLASTSSGSTVNGSESYHLSNVHLVSLGLPKTSQGSTLLGSLGLQGLLRAAMAMRRRRRRRRRRLLRGRRIRQRYFG